MNSTAGGSAVRRARPRAAGCSSTKSSSSGMTPTIGDRGRRHRAGLPDLERLLVLERVTGHRRCGGSQQRSAPDSSAGGTTAAGAAFLRRLRVALAGAAGCSTAVSWSAAAAAAPALAGITTAEEPSVGVPRSSGAAAAVDSAAGAAALRRLRVALTGGGVASASCAASLALAASIDAPGSTPGASTGTTGTALRRGARVRRTGVVLAAASPGGVTAPSRSPPSSPRLTGGSLSSMGALQFWRPRARVSAATQGRRKCFGPGRRIGRAAEVCQSDAGCGQLAPSDGVFDPGWARRTIRVQRIDDIPLRW